METLPTFKDLTSTLTKYEDENSLMYLLNQLPPENWIKTHPIIKNYRYLPIDKIEHFLRNIFREYKIEVLREGTAFNGVYVVVRVHYRDLLDGDMKYHDGIGASELQTKKGESVANLNAINPGAISMAFPIAKTIAIKDACDHFGRLFGSDLNRKDLVPIKQPKEIDHDLERMKTLVETAETLEDIEFAKQHVTDEVLKADLKLKEVQLKKVKK